MIPSYQLSKINHLAALAVRQVVSSIQGCAPVCRRIRTIYGTQQKGGTMNARPLFLCAALAAPAWAQTFDADGNIVSSGRNREAPNPALYEQQKRNAAVLGNLVDQTPEYWEGHAIVVESIRNREAAQRSAPRQGEKASGSMGYDDRHDLQEANDKLERVANDKRMKPEQRDAASRALRDEQRQIYSRAGVASPVAPEPPPRPVIVHQVRPSPPIDPPRETFHVNGEVLNGSNGTTLHCSGGFCH
jgi:hypothetical protein